MRRPWRIVAIVLFTLTLAAGGLIGDRVLAVGDEARESLRLYTDLVTTAHDRYGTEVTFRDLVYASIGSMLRSLDPHTSFLTPRAYTGMRERQQTSFYGLGILVGMRNGRLTVITPLDGTPASRLGIRAGDVIGTIEGEPTDSLSLNEAVEKLKGPKGTKVNITIERRGLDAPLEMQVTRAEIPQTTVRQAYMLDEGTGYLQVSEFSRGTGDEVAEALEGLREQGMERLILDLRNNGGGLLDQAIEVSDQFLPEKSMIVETRGRTRDSRQSYRATDRHPELGLPLVVLVNGGTASAAEILSGAIQDHDVGYVVGTPTWGKGLVQTVYSLSYGAGLALTTAKYYTPSGRLIQRDYSSFYDYYNYGTSDDEPREPNGEVYETDLGREVYGGGGITPDVVVEAEEMSGFGFFLIARSAFFDFAVEWLNRYGVTGGGEGDGPTDAPAVAARAVEMSPITGLDWEPPPELLDEFKQWLVDEELASAEEVAEAFTEDPGLEEFARLRLHGELMNAAFGQEAQSRVLARGDNQIQAAFELFDDAEELLAQREALGLRSLDRRAERTDEEAGAGGG